MRRFYIPAFAVFVCLACISCNRSSSSSEPRLSSAKIAANRLEWHRKCLLDAYRTNGYAKPAWGTAAEEALELYAEVRAGTKPLSSEALGTLRRSLTTAVSAGCEDPLIRYLHARFVMKTPDPVQYGQTMASIAQTLNFSGYHPLIKCFAYLRAAEASSVEITNNRLPEHVGLLRFSASTNMLEVARDRNTPVADVQELVETWLFTIRNSPRQFSQDIQFVEPALKDWGNEPLILLSRAQCFIAFAWVGRGPGYAESVTPEGWKLFNERLTTAKGLLEAAWKADPKDTKTATAMLDVVLGLGMDRNKMEQWFSRAITLNTNNYTACSKMLRFLEPKWNGTPEQMRAFGRECVSRPWGGQVPLTLVDAHEKIYRMLPEEQQRAYWTQPDVWKEVDSSFRKFFQLNPDAVDFRHNYAWHAFYAGKYELFNEQLSQFNGTNYSYFGGKTAFDEMVATANASRQ